MKHIILIGNGMADEPMRELGGKTPLQAAVTPNLDRLAKQGAIGRVQLCPEGYYPDSDLALFGLLGYPAKKFYPGRGFFEAESLDLNLQDDEIAFRCNFVTVNSTKMLDHAAGQIGSREASILVGALNDQINIPEARFYSQTRYRQLLVIRDATLSKQLRELSCVPPQEVRGRKFKPALPKGKGRKFLLDIIQRSHHILEEHDINKVRIDLNENPANMIWPWGAALKRDLPSFYERHQLKACMIAGSASAQGLAKTLKMDNIEVPGASGYYDTDYLAKVEYAVRAMDCHDAIILHVQAPDEASLNGDLKHKIEAIEQFDSLVVSGILNSIKKEAHARLLVSSNVVAPVALRTHTATPALFLMSGYNVKKDAAGTFDEAQAASSKLEFTDGTSLLESFINK